MKDSRCFKYFRYNKHLKKFLIKKSKKNQHNFSYVKLISIVGEKKIKKKAKGTHQT